MNMPRFSAEASLYRANQHYVTVTAQSSTPKSVMPQQLSSSVRPGLTGRVPWPWCSLACEYCRDYGYACFPCWICAIIVANTGELAF